MMKVGFFVDRPPVYNGGYSQRIIREMNMVNGLDGVDSYLMAFVPSGEYVFSSGKIKDKLKALPAEQVDIRHLVSSHIRIKRSLYDKFYAYILKKWVQKKHIDGLICENLWCAYIGAMVSKELGIKSVFDYHGIVPEESVYDNRCKIGDKDYNYLKSIEKYAINNSTNIICVSNRFKNYIIDTFGVDKDKISVVPCCVNDIPDTINFEKRKEIRASLGIERRKVIIYAGSIVKYQCVDEMIEIFSNLIKVDNSFYFLFLSAYNNYESLKGKFAQYHIDESFYTMRSVKQDEVFNYLCASDFGFLIRDNNLLNKVSSPTKLAEYLMAGLPIVATNSVGDINDISSKVILCDYSNIKDDSFFNEIADFDTSLENRTKNFSVAKKYLEDNLTWSSYEEVYKHIIML